MSEHCINKTRKKNQTNIIKRSKANYKNKNIQMNTLKQRSALNKKNTGEESDYSYHTKHKASKQRTRNSLTHMQFIKYVIFCDEIIINIKLLK